MARNTEDDTTDPLPDCVIRYATTDDVPALRQLVQRANARLFCGPALVADVGGDLGAAVSLADGHVIADPSQPASVLRQLLRTRRDIHTGASLLPTDEHDPLAARLRAAMHDEWTYPGGVTLGP